MTKISPIAVYLTENRAKTIKQGNILRFVSPEGMYLGHQIKTEQGNATAYSIEIFSGLKKMFFQTTVIGQELVYVRNRKSPIGLSLVPTKTCIYKGLLDFINNVTKMKQIIRNLKNDLELVATDEETGVNFYDTELPFVYEDIIEQEKTSPISKKFIRYHFDKN